MKYNNQDIIGQVVAKDYRTASVFKNAGIDFCCQGNRTIQEACNKRNILVSDVLEALENVSISTETQTDFDSWPLDLMVDYIEKKHHRYVEDKSQEIKPFLDKICKVHGSAHPELLEIKKEFNESVGELAMHMKREELVLFPFIRKLVNAKSSKDPVVQPSFGTVNNPIEKMMDEHSTEGERFRKISELSSNYKPPSDACNTYKVTYALLKEFEDDLHLHIHLENNILFPKAMDLEKELV